MTVAAFMKLKVGQWLKQEIGPIYQITAIWEGTWEKNQTPQRNVYLRTSDTTCSVITSDDAAYIKTWSVTK